MRALTKTVGMELMIMNAELKTRIEAAIAGTRSGRQRANALSRIKWVIARDDGRMVSDGWISGPIRWTSDAAQARVFDGRDNEDFKLRFHEALAKQPLRVVVL